MADAIAPGDTVTAKVTFEPGKATVENPPSVVSIQAARAAREAAKAKSAPPPGNCARGAREECGLLDPAGCVVHAPYLPEPDAV